MGSAVDDDETEGVEGMSLSPEDGAVITVGGGDKQVFGAEEEERERRRARVMGTGNR